MNSYWQSLGWTLVHFLWQGVAIALLYWIADRVIAALVPSRAAGARYVLALAALLAMPVVALVTLAHEEASVAPAAAAIRPAPAPPAAAPALSAADLTTLTAGASPRTASLALTSRALLSAAIPWLDVVWLAGVFFFALRSLGGWWLIRRLRLITLDQAPHTLRLHLDVLRRQMGIRRLVDLRLSRRIINPLTAGALRPWILLPISALTCLSPEQLESVLAHELAHIRRADYLWNLVQTLVETLFFFHPAMWYISRRVREEREFCCDDAVLARCADPAVYASALVRLEEERRGSLRFAMALDGHQSRAGLRTRVLRILGHTGEPSRSFRPLSLTAVAAGLLLFLCPLPKVFASFHFTPQSAESQTSKSAQSANSNQSANPPAPPPQAEPAAKPSAATPAPATDATTDNEAEPAPQPVAVPASGVVADPEPQAEPPQENSSPTSAHSDYIDQMRAAGINVDLDQYIAMKVQGITPAYVSEMTKAFGAMPTGHQLIAMKVQDVTPDYIAAMRAAGYNASADKFIAMRVQDVTPEYAKAMAGLGLGTPTVDDLIAMKVQDVDAGDAAKMRAEGLDVHSFHDLITDRIFQVTPEFINGMRDAGFDHIAAHDLVSMRIQDVTPEFAKSAKAQFPGVTVQNLIQMRIFKIDDAFIASAKRHGFTDLTIDKLVKLRISGILDDSDDTRK